MPRTVIGLFGYTGCGKSSLINALIEEERLLPTNGMRASTAVVIEVSHNPSEDPREKYAADIEFCDPDEWAAEFNILRGDIIHRPEGEKLAADSKSDAGVGFAKLKAVYPGIDITTLSSMTRSQIVNDPNLVGVLGSSIKVYSASAKEFHKSINQYVDSSNKISRSGQLEFWPLVRLVKVFVKANILKQGLVLVDLPGVCDSNAGRGAVAERYIKNLKYMWVVADINRAVDDRVAQELLGTSFKIQLLMNGNYHESFVTFIMTKTDIIDPDEVMGTLGLANSILRNEVMEEERLKEELEELEDSEADNISTQEYGPSQISLKRKYGAMKDGMNVTIIFFEVYLLT